MAKILILNIILNILFSFHFIILNQIIFSISTHKYFISLFKMQIKRNTTMSIRKDIKRDYNQDFGIQEHFPEQFPKIRKEGYRLCKASILCVCMCFNI